MTCYNGLSMAVDRHLEKKAGIGGKLVGLGGMALNGWLGQSADVADARQYDPLPKKPWYDFDNLGNIGDWTIGFIPGIGSLWSLGRAGASALRGDWGEAGWHALGAIPLGGRFLSAAGKAGRAAVAAGRAGMFARGASRAANAASRVGSSIAKIPYAGAFVRSPGVREMAWYFAKDPMIQNAHQLGSARRENAYVNDYISRYPGAFQPQGGQQTEARNVTF